MRSGDWNRSRPSVKNGRFSGKKVSKVERLRTRWSASTCPKSGFNVPTRDTSLATVYRRSRPAQAPATERGVYPTEVQGAKSSGAVASAGAGRVVALRVAK